MLTYLAEGVGACWNDERLGGVTGHSFPDPNIKINNIKTQLTRKPKVQ